jgi:hypothetical protein
MQWVLLWLVSGGIGIVGSKCAHGMSFDLLAPHYRWMEIVLAGEKLQRCRTAFLDAINPPHNVLLAGEGHGRCLVECCRRFPKSHFVCLDASRGMLSQARHQLTLKPQASPKVRFIHADILTWSPPPRSFDLIITNFFLDCFREDQMETIIHQLAVAASSGTNWLLADFQVARTGLRRIRCRLLLWVMYAFFRTATHLPARQLTVPDTYLKRAGFILHRRIESEWGLLHSDWWRSPGS